MVRASMQEVGFLLQMLQPYKGTPKVDKLVDALVDKLSADLLDEESTIEPVDKPHGKAGKK